MRAECETNLFPELGDKYKIVRVVFKWTSHNICLWLGEALAPKLSCSCKILIDLVFFVCSEEAGLQDLDCLELLNF